MQTFLLLVTENRFRAWIYGISTTWTPGYSKHHDNDVAAILAAEYMVPKATICLAMLVIGAASFVGLPARTLHFTAVVIWTGLRQVRC